MHVPAPKYVSSFETNRDIKFVERESLFCLLVKYLKDVNTLTKGSRE